MAQANPPNTPTKKNLPATPARKSSKYCVMPDSLLVGEIPHPDEKCDRHDDENPERDGFSHGHDTSYRNAEIATPNTFRAISARRKSRFSIAIVNRNFATMMALPRATPKNRAPARVRPNRCSRNKAPRRTR